MYQFLVRSEACFFKPVRNWLEEYVADLHEIVPLTAEKRIRTGRKVLVSDVYDCYLVTISQKWAAACFHGCFSDEEGVIPLDCDTLFKWF